MTFTPEQRESAARAVTAMSASTATNPCGVSDRDVAIDLCCERDQARRERDLAREALIQIRHRINQCREVVPDYVDYCAVIATDALEAK